MDLDGITPDQLRELADKIEDSGQHRMAHEVVDALQEKVVSMRPHIRHVEVDGVSIDIDMRRVRDYRALSLIAKVEAGDSFAAITLFEFLLGNQKDAAIEQLSDEGGFCDAERFVKFCGKLLTEVGAKN